MSNHRAHREHAGLPVRQLVILAACRVAEPLAYTSVFPYLPEMIESFGVNKTNVAKWAGITSAAFSLAQSATAIVWGGASDYFGRKPMVILALFSTMVTIIVFGFSQSLPWAIASRAAAGAFNGNIGIMRTMVAEMVPEKVLQPRAFSVLPLVWAVGSTVGPAFGGFFATPTENLPYLFGNSKFFTKFPFALPNLLSAIIFMICITIAIFYLKETLEGKKEKPDYGLILGQRLLDFVEFRLRRLRGKSDADAESKRVLLGRDSATLGSNMADDDEWTPLNIKPARHSKPTQALPRIREVFTRQASINLLVYTILALHSISFDQLLPVFLHHPVRIPDEDNISLPFKFSGGFGLGSGRIGMLFTLFGISSGIVQFAIFPPMARHYGVLNCFKACSVTFPLVYLVTPFTALIQNSMLQQGIMVSIMIVKSFCIVFSFPCITILLTNSASSLKVLGTLNGIATTLSALGRAAGPAMSGALFTWGVDRGYMIAPWWALGFIAALGVIPVWKIIETDGFENNRADGANEEEGTEDE